MADTGTGSGRSGPGDGTASTAAAVPPIAPERPAPPDARPPAPRRSAPGRAAPGRSAPPPPRAAPKPARRSRFVRPRVVERRYRQTIRRIDLWTVLKMSICFYLTALLVMLGAGIVIWWIATQVGVIDGVEEFMGDILSSPDFEFLSWRILRGATLIGLVLVCLMVVITTLAAAFYNVFSELVGGVEVTVSEEENPRR